MTDYTQMPGSHHVLAMSGCCCHWTNVICAVLVLCRSPEDVAKAVQAVEKKLPKRIKRKRPITTEDGLEVGQEEYYDYVFPEEAGAAPSLKLLEAAYKWKRQRVEGAEDRNGGTTGQEELFDNS